MLSSDFGATFLRERLTGPSLKASFFSQAHVPTCLLEDFFFAKKTWSPTPCFCIFSPKDIWLLWYSTKIISHLSLWQGPHQPWWKAQENTTKAGTHQKPGQWWQSSKGLDLGGVLEANFYLGEATIDIPLRRYNYRVQLDIFSWCPWRENQLHNPYKMNKVVHFKFISF